MSYDWLRQRSLPTFETMIAQTNVPSKNWGLLLSRTTLTPKTCGLLLMETTKDSSARYFPLSQTIGVEYVFLFAMFRIIADSSGRCFPLSRTIRDKSVFLFSMFNRLSDRYPGRGAKAYAPCAFIIYPFALCRAFGRAYAIRPYPAGRKIRFQGLVGGYVWDKGRSIRISFLHV